MGGCRCTYKNCTVRSDGKTHLFHYPVFDKVRCHEWLSNAGRYDFLNLKVSQLKNRCICQHHFSDNWFMNDNKEKLKTHAVPTLDGPYCDSSDPGMPQNMMGVYPLACEVIENEDFLDRKSNYNVVYADFLTNSERMDTLKDCVNNTDDKELSINLTDIENVTPVNNNKITEGGHKLRSVNTVHNKTKKDSSALFVEIPALAAEQNNENRENKVKIEDKPIELNNTDVSNKPAQKTRSKVRIISEKKITDPRKKIRVPVSNESFKVVKPSMILNFGMNKGKTEANDVQEMPIVPNNVGESMRNEVLVESKTDNNKEPEIDKKEVSDITEILTSNDPSQFDMKIDIIDTKPKSKLKPNQKKITKNIMSPERVAAIKEKRKFNMKIKDIIAQELNRLDEQNCADKDILIPMKKNTNKQGTETVMSSLSNDSSLPNEHSYIVHYLEARMEKMENILLQKIDQNTKKIMDLKRTLDTQEEKLPESKTPLKKPKMSDEAYKKYLFNEISKYLTHSSNSLIYEELFIDKYVAKERNTGLTPRSSKRIRNRL